MERTASSRASVPGDQHASYEPGITKPSARLTVLSAEILDAIDAIVPPGTDLAPDEKVDTPPSLLDASLRRRNP